MTAINRWAEERTEGLIDHVINPNAISPLTRLIIATATYFKAAWHTPFEKFLTNAAKFHPLNGGDVDIQMMETTMDLPYARHAEFQAVEIPYAVPDVRFAIVLPDTGKFDAVERSLDGGLLDAVLFGEAKAMTRIQLQLPRFRLSAGVDLRPSLEAIGIRELFDERADLSGISSEPGFQIDQILHNSVISVDEDGTEAATVTVTAMMGSASEELDEPVLVTADRPFLFFIVDRPTRTILFAGRFLQPE